MGQMARRFDSSSASRADTRALARLDAERRFEIAVINKEADKQAEIVSAVAYVARHGLHEVAMLSQLESQLGALVPTAIPRLQGIADMAALGIAETIASTPRKVS